MILVGPLQHSFFCDTVKLNRTGPNSEPLGTPLVTGHQLDLAGHSTHRPLDLAIQPFFYPLKSAPAHDQPVTPGACCGNSAVGIQECVVSGSTRHSSSL